MLVGMDGKDDNRNIGPGPNALKHLGAFEIRQVEIEDDQVDRTHGRGLEPGGGVLGLDHAKTVEFEAGAQKAPDLRLIVDDQYLSHPKRPQAPACRRKPSAAAATWSCRD